MVLMVLVCVCFSICSKFEETTSLNTTVEESIKVMNAFDTNADQKLDQKEFALFIARFAETCGANLSGMIDFMIDVIPKDEHPFRNVYPANFRDEVMNYQNSIWDWQKMGHTLIQAIETMSSRVDSRLRKHSTLRTWMMKSFMASRI